MNRREAIKNISISFGSITLSTGVLSMIQSCQTDNIDWSPDYFKKNQINFIDRIFEIIIPETDTPGATSLNLSRFVDAYIFRNVSKENQNELNAGINEFIDVILKNENKRSINEIDSVSLEKHLSNHLDSESYIDSDGKNYSQLCGLFREMSVRAYKLSEYVMTNKLGYVPIPGYYDGNVDV